jgi:membrane-bound lytic murein transglycosylase D
MGTIVRVVCLSLILPVLLFLLISVPKLDGLIDRRLPLLTVFFLARQLEAEIDAASVSHGDIPPTYARILEEYSSLRDHPFVRSARDLSADTPTLPLSERLIARLLLMRQNLPKGFLASDPVQIIMSRLDKIDQDERKLDALRAELVRKEALEQIDRHAHRSQVSIPVRYELPPDVTENGLVFCREYIPLGRADVRRRIEQQIEYLLTDFRSDTTLWLKRRDRYGSVIADILKRENVPREFALLPALESGYNRSVVSPSNARGWWQFIRPTAVRSTARQASLDWTMNVDKYFDQRCDLVKSTRAAARYLTWMRRRIAKNKGGKSWLTVAAAYNAGLVAVIHRARAFRTGSYWDMKLPRETEVYVPRWIAFCIIDAHRQYYDCEVQPVAQLEFDTISRVRLTKDVPLSLLAVVTGCSVRFLREVNGGLRRAVPKFPANAGPGAKTYDIHIPKGSKTFVIRELIARKHLAER